MRAVVLISGSGGLQRPGEGKNPSASPRSARRAALLADGLLYAGVRLAQRRQQAAQALERAVIDLAHAPLPFRAGSSRVPGRPGPSCARHDVEFVPLVTRATGLRGRSGRAGRRPTVMVVRPVPADSGLLHDPRPGTAPGAAATTLILHLAAGTNAQLRPVVLVLASAAACGAVLSIRRPDSGARCPPGGHAWRSRLGVTMTAMAGGDGLATGGGRSSQVYPVEYHDEPGRPAARSRRWHRPRFSQCCLRAGW